MFFITVHQTNKRREKSGGARVKEKTDGSFTSSKHVLEV